MRGTGAHGRRGTGERIGQQAGDGGTSDERLSVAAALSGNNGAVEWTQSSFVYITS